MFTEVIEWGSPQGL